MTSTKSIPQNNDGVKTIFSETVRVIESGEAVAIAPGHEQRIARSINGIVIYLWRRPNDETLVLLARKEQCLPVTSKTMAFWGSEYVGQTTRGVWKVSGNARAYYNQFVDNVQRTLIN